MINIYTDGACSGNPGIGGWGVVILDNNKEILLNGGDQHTTNNKMELTAAIKALEYFETKKDLTIYTDSKYVKDGIDSWIINWKKNGWKTSTKKIVKNKELWMQLDNLINNESGVINMTPTNAKRDPFCWLFKFWNIKFYFPNNF